MTGACMYRKKRKIIREKDTFQKADQGSRRHQRWSGSGRNCRTSLCQRTAAIPCQCKGSQFCPDLQQPGRCSGTIRRRGGSRTARGRSRRRR